MFPSHLLSAKRPCPPTEPHPVIRFPLLGRKISLLLRHIPACSGIQKTPLEASYFYVHKICALPVDIHVDDGPTSGTGVIASSVPIVQALLHHSYQLDTLRPLVMMMHH